MALKLYLLVLKFHHLLLCLDDTVTVRYLNNHVALFADWLSHG